MKKLIGIIVGFALVVSAAAAFGMTSEPADATSCTKGTKYTDFTGNYTGRDTMTVWTKGNKKLCNDVKMNFGTFKILNTYNGKGFPHNPTALPQTSIYNKTVTLKKGTDGKTTVKVEVPDDCTDYQIDAYIGPVQTEITTNAGLLNTAAIVKALFQRLKTDCSVKVKVCDPATGTIITVPEADKDKYKPENDPACQPPTKTEACNTETGIVEKVDKGKENTPPHTTDLSKCEEKPAPEKVDACNTETGVIEKVDKGQENTPPHTSDLSKCNKQVKVCDENTGKIITVPEADADKYGDVDSDACAEKTPETPSELPTTGIGDTFQAILGLGSLTAATYYYAASRRG